MLELLKQFFSSGEFMPHGHCYLWRPELVWTMVSTDLLIGLAYLSISLSLYALVRKIQLPFSAMFLAFGVFIGACGATHFMEVLTLWHPVYWVAAFLKVVTAGASVITAILLYPLAPKAIELAANLKLSENRRIELEKSHVALSRQTEELTKAYDILSGQQKILMHTAKMSALGEMAGGIAHEINSPLGIITVHANQLERFLKRNILTPEIIEQEAKLIASTAKRIGEIIKGLRAFAREGEKDPFETAKVIDMLRDSLILCQNRFKTHSVEIRLLKFPENLEVECRSTQIGQVFLNLFNNSFDVVSDLKDRWIEIEVQDQGDEVEISVKDSGLGILPEVASKMMQPFFTTKEVGKGTGLGLSISRGIAESHGGKLWLDASCANTRFVLRLPKKHQV